MQHVRNLVAVAMPVASILVVLALTAAPRMRFS
jgi:hypothetical protein